jgi:naphthoate synthase
MVGDKRAREIWYLCRQYSTADAFQMGMVNAVVPLASLEATAVQWAREILEKSPLAVRLMKAAINAAGDGLSGQQQLAG